MANPDTTILTQPEVRSRFEWRVCDLRAAKMSADMGSLAMAADLCEAMLGDDRIQGTFESRIAALTGAEITFEAAGDRRKGRRVAKALEVEEDWWKIVPEDQLGLLLKWGRLLGVGVGQLGVEEDEETGRWLPRLDVWHPRFLHFSSAEGWSIDVADGPDKTRLIPLEPGDGRWVLYTPYGPTRPWAHGLWRGLALWWMLKTCAMSDWGRHSEIASKGVVTSPMGTTINQRRELVEAIRDAGKDSQIGLPPGFDYKLVESAADGAAMYGAQIQMAHTAFAVSVRGNNLSTEVQDGSLAAATAHADVALAHTRADAETLSTTAHDQVLTWWADWNFGDRALAPWPVWDVEPPEDQTAKATMFAALAGAVPMLASVGGDARAILEEFGVPLVPPGTPLPAPPGMPSLFGAARLASGAIVAKASPFVEGQDYADRVTESGVALASDAVAPAVDAILALISKAASFDDLRNSILDAYSTMDPNELALLLERSFIMADLAGRYHAQQEET